MFDLHTWIENLPVAEDTKKLLNELIKRKEKKMQLKYRLIYLSIINGFIVTMITFWLVKVNMITNASIFGVMDYLSSSKASVFFIILSASIFIYSGSVSREYKKHKDKYQALREETSRKLSVTWKINEDSKLKDQISEVLKSQKDITIRYTR